MTKRLPKRPSRRSSALTVPQVAERFGISERTVWTDIATKRLRALHYQNGATRIPRESLTSYRGGPVGYVTDGAPIDDELLVTVAWVANASGYAIRSIRRHIAAGILPIVRMSSRRVYVRLGDAQSVYEVLLRVKDVADLASETVRQTRHNISAKNLLRPLRDGSGHLWITRAAALAYARLNGEKVLKEGDNEEK